MSADNRLTYRQERERALAGAQKLQRQIEHLVARPEHINGSPPQEALYYLLDVVSMLSPDRQDSTSNGDQDPTYIRAQPAKPDKAEG